MPNSKTIPFKKKSRLIHTDAGDVSLSFYYFPEIEKRGFPHAFSTRLGGVSFSEKKELNLAFKNDSEENVRENRRRFLNALPFPQFPIRTNEQIHSDIIIDVEPHKEEDVEGDALVTKDSNLYLGIKTADCLPILLADPKSGMVAAVHAGWRGTLQRITEKTCLHLRFQYGVDLTKCFALLGPSACVKCFEIGSDVVEDFNREFDYAAKLLRKKTGSNQFYLDNRKANREQLRTYQIPEDHILNMDLCTMHQNDEFFSYRKEGAQSGRLLSVIGRKS